MLRFLLFFSSSLFSVQHCEMRLEGRVREMQGEHVVSFVPPLVLYFSFFAGVFYHSFSSYSPLYKLPRLLPLLSVVF